MNAFANLQPFVIALAAAALLLGALHDLAARTIPHAVPLVLFASGLVLRLLEGQAPLALAATAAVFAGCMLAWRRGWLGGGDVKLLTACAMLVGPAQVPDLILATALAGGVLAAIYLLAFRAARAAGPISGRSRPAGLPARLWRAERWRLLRRAPLPYACAICAGAIATLHWG